MAKRLKHPIHKTVMWRLPNEPGSEIVTIKGTPGEGLRFNGQVQLVDSGAPVLIEYLILCDDTWATKYVDLMVTHGNASTRYVQLLVDSEKGWLRRDAPDRESAPIKPFDPVAGLDNVVDVDLEFSPITNWLPIRRLAPRIGWFVEPTAAWVRFPSLSIEPLSQKYTCISPTLYRYESATGFSAEVEVDDLGLVVKYGNIWQRVAATE
jgi:hypothetical protein